MMGYHWIIFVLAFVAFVAAGPEVEADGNSTSSVELQEPKNVTQFGASTEKESTFRSKKDDDGEGKADYDEDDDDDDEEENNTNNTRVKRKSRRNDDDDDKDDDDDDDDDDDKNQRRGRKGRKNRDDDNDNEGRTPKFNICGGSENTNAIQLHVHKFPNPLLLIEGEKLNIAFTAVVTETLPEPIYARISIRKKVLGLWNRIPCVGRVGSCEYEVTCDKIRKQYGGKMNQPCPPPVGKTKREFTFTIPRIPRIVKSFASGTYKIKAELFTKKKKRGELLACSETHVRVQT